MPEPTTETTQAQVGNVVIQDPPITTTTEQGTAGASTTPAPSQTNVEQTTTQTTTPPSTTQPPKPTPAEVQKRIDRMYARLQEERKQRLAAEARVNTTTTQPPVVDSEDIEGQPTIGPKPLTETDVEAIVERKEHAQKVVESEMRVFERHPSALNDDGTFNLNDSFVQKYIEIGRANPMLGTMANGPEMAEAMVDKMLGVDYKKGRQDEATRTTQSANSFTTTSTTAIPPTTNTAQLSAMEQKVARRMGITDQEYIANKASNKVMQKSWEVKIK